MLRLKKKYRTCQCVCYYKGRLQQFNAAFLTHTKSQINALKILSELWTPHGGTKKGRTTFAPHAHHAWHQNYRRKLASKTQWSSPFAFLLLHPHTTTLSVFITARPRWERGFSCCDKGPFGTGRPPTKAWHVQGRATTQCHLCQLSILQENRDLVTRPSSNPMTCNASLHTLPSRNPLEDTLSSSDHDSPSLSHIGLFGQPIFHSSPKPGTWHPSPSLPSSAITCKAMSAHFLEDISREEGGTDVSIEEGAWRSHCPTPLLAPSESGRKRARHAARTSLAHSTMDAVRKHTHTHTHYPSDLCRAKHSSRSFFPQT